MGLFSFWPLVHLPFLSSFLAQSLCYLCSMSPGYIWGGCAPSGAQRTVSLFCNKTSPKQHQSNPNLVVLSPSHHYFSSLSTPCFITYVSLDRIRSSSTWAFTVRLCVCSSSPFPGPWGASAWDLGVFRIFEMFAPLTEVDNWKTLPNQTWKKKSPAAGIVP